MKGLGSIPSQGTRIPHATIKSLYSTKMIKDPEATTNTWHSQINEQGTSLVIQWVRTFLAIQGDTGSVSGPEN